jgi:hypothetical protein
MHEGLTVGGWLDLHSPVSRRGESQQDDVGEVVHDAPHAAPARERAVMNQVQPQHLVGISEYLANRLLSIAEPVQNNFERPMARMRIAWMTGCAAETLWAGYRGGTRQGRAIYWPSARAPWP